ncbi:hypothetical protein LCGC14_3009140, partial [marine sediment metagenome]
HVFNMLGESYEKEVYVYNFVSNQMLLNALKSNLKS